MNPGPHNHNPDHVHVALDPRNTRVMNHFTDGRSQLSLVGNLGGGTIAGHITNAAKPAIMAEWEAAVANGSQVMTHSTYVMYETRVT
jgi:hypothetical protein